MVNPGKKIRIEKVNKKEGEQVVFKEVLLMEKSKKVEIGTPFLKGVEITADVIKQGKGDKVIVFKYKAKKRYKAKTGHRQPYTEVRINTF